MCDDKQIELIKTVERHWGTYSSLYNDVKFTEYDRNILDKVKERGFMMLVRNNRRFRAIIPQFDPQESILLYSMWDGYRTREGSTFPEFLELTPTWASLHTGGHASQQDLRMVIERTTPKTVIPIHTIRPERLQSLCPQQTITLLNDGEAWTI